MPNSTDEPRILARIDVSGTIRELMDVARVAVMPSMGQVPKPDAIVALTGLLGLVDRSMPAELQAQDRRVLAARHVLGLLQQ